MLRLALYLREIFMGHWRGCRNTAVKPRSGGLPLSVLGGVPGCEAACPRPRPGVDAVDAPEAVHIEAAGRPGGLQDSPHHTQDGARGVISSDIGHVTAY